MTDTVEKVAEAICDEMTNGNATLADVSDRDKQAYRAAARSAIRAYDAAKWEAQTPYVVRVEKGVTYWSNGLCSQEWRAKDYNYEADLARYATMQKDRT